MFTAMGAEARLRIMRLLIAAHADGMVVGEIHSELGIAASTLSHHLEKLKHAGLVTARREHQFLRYVAATGELEKLLYCGHVFGGYGSKPISADGAKRICRQPMD